MFFESYVFAGEFPDLYDTAKGIDVDCAGMSIVTGTILTPDGRKYGTIKYNQEGELIWVSFLDGGDTWDLQQAQAVDVKLGEYGNVVVAGTIDTGNTDEDYSVVKYSPYGEQLWHESYNAHEKGSFDSVHDEIDVLTVDKSGNIYVSGTFCVTEQEHIRYCSIGTIKYDSNGVRQWISSYDDIDFYGGYVIKIEIDMDGGVYVYFQIYPYGIVVKYSSEGSEIWSLSWDPGDYGEHIGSIEVSKLGDIFVTGSKESSFTTIKYDSDANEIWETKICDGSSGYGRKIIRCINEDIYVIGSCEHEEIMVKYDVYGDEIWIVESDTPVRHMSVDSECNLYVSGSTRNEDDSADTIETSKYDNNGELVWRHVYPSYGTEIGYDSTDLSGIALDESNSALYVTGTNYVYNANYNLRIFGYLTIKYDLNGNVLWVDKYENNGKFEDTVFIDYDHPCYHEDIDDDSDDDDDVDEDDDNNDDSDTCGCGCS